MTKKKLVLFFSILLIIILIVIFATLSGDEIKKSPDTVRINNLKAMQAGVEQCYQDNMHYPEKIEQILKYMNKLPTDAKEGLIINGCKFGYKYEVGIGSDGSKNGSYNLSTCFEDTANIITKASKDGGKDPLRYEVWSK